MGGGLAGKRKSLQMMVTGNEVTQDFAGMDCRHEKTLSQIMRKFRRDVSALRPVPDSLEVRLVLEFIAISPIAKMTSGFYRSVPAKNPFVQGRTK